MVNLVVIVIRVPMEARRVGFAGQVLVPLTSLNAHTKADVRSLWAAPLFMCKNLMRLSHTDYFSFVFFCIDRDGETRVRNFEGELFVCTVCVKIKLVVVKYTNCRKAINTTSCARTHTQTLRTFEV